MQYNYTERLRAKDASGRTTPFRAVCLRVLRLIAVAALLYGISPSAAISDTKPASLVARLQRMRVTLPAHGHQLSDSFSYATYTAFASDELPAPRLLFDAQGTPYLVYADRSYNTRVARLRSDLTIEREVFFRERAYPTDAILADNGFALLLIDFDVKERPHGRRSRHGREGLVVL